MDGINQFNAASVAPSVIPAPKREDAKEGTIEMAHILVPTDDPPARIGQDSSTVADASHLLSHAPTASAGAMPVGSDFSMSFDPKTARKDAIAQMYRDVLNREPDAAGLKYWSDSGLSLDRVKSEIAHSPEAQNNARFKDAVRSFLGREATQGELDWFHGQQRLPGTSTDGIIANFKDIQRDNAIRSITGREPLESEKQWFSEQLRHPGNTYQGVSANFRDIQRDNAARAAAHSPTSAPSPSTSDAQVRAFKDFLLSDTIFRYGVNTATDGKYHDPAIEKATQDFLVAGTRKGLGLEDIKKAAKAYSDRFQAWQRDTSGPRPTPEQFLQKTYHQTAF